MRTPIARTSKTSTTTSALFPTTGTSRSPKIAAMPQDSLRQSGKQSQDDKIKISPVAHIDSAVPHSDRCAKASNKALRSEQEGDSCLGVIGLDHVNSLPFFIWFRSITTPARFSLSFPSHALRFSPSFSLQFDRFYRSVFTGSRCIALRN